MPERTARYWADRRFRKLMRKGIADLRKQRALEKLPFGTLAKNVGSQSGLPTDLGRKGRLAGSVRGSSDSCPNVYSGLAIHRWVLNRCENFLLYSSFHRVTNQLIWSVLLGIDPF
jgi:hypothetical protein